MVKPTLTLTTPLGRDTDVVELLAMYVKLKNLGKEIIGLCPFNDDYSPSLTVNRGETFGAALPHPVIRVTLLSNS